jgi:hypothetical protein
VNWSEQQYLDYLRAHGLPLDPTLTAPGCPGGAAMPEKALLAQIRGLAKAHSWLTYHVFDARRSEEGYPDLTLVKPGRLIFAELKSEKGKLSHEQAVWLDMLRHSIPGIEVYCWRPRDLPTIAARLAQKEPPC